MKESKSLDDGIYGDHQPAIKRYTKLGMRCLLMSLLSFLFLILVIIIRDPKLVPLMMIFYFLSGVLSLLGLFYVYKMYREAEAFPFVGVFILIGNLFFAVIVWGMVLFQFITIIQVFTR